MADASKVFTTGAECAVSFNAVPIVAKSETLALTPSFYEPGDGFIGGLEPHKERRRVLKQDVKGSITFQPTYTEAIALLTGFFSGTSAESSASFAGYTPRGVPGTPAQYTVLVDRRHASGKIFSYPSCWMNKISITVAESAPVDIVCDFLGTTEGTATASIAAAEAALPAIMDDCTITIAGDQYFANGGEFIVDLALDERFHNSLTRSHAQRKVLNATAKIDLDLNSDTWSQLLKHSTDNDSVVVTVKCSNGVKGFGLSFPEMCITSATPTISGADSVKASLELKGYKQDASTATVTAFTKAS